MKEYKLVTLNPTLRLSPEKDIRESEETLNKYVREGWELQHIVQYHAGYLIAVMYKDTYQLN